MKHVVFICLFVFITSGVIAQDKKKALERVELYIKSKLNNPQIYTFDKLHGLFKQQDAEKIGKQLKSTIPIKYTLVLTYKLKDSIVDFNYFHLDKNYNVIGVLTKDDMLKSVFSEIGDMLTQTEYPFDHPPLYSNETFSTIILKNKKLKKEVTYKKGDLILSYDQIHFLEMIDIIFFSNEMHRYRKIGINVHKYIDTCTSNCFNRRNVKIISFT